MTKTSNLLELCYLRCKAALHEKPTIILQNGLSMSKPINEIILREIAQLTSEINYLRFLLNHLVINNEDLLKNVNQDTFCMARAFADQEVAKKLESILNELKAEDSDNIS